MTAQCQDTTCQNQSNRGRHKSCVLLLLQLLRRGPAKGFLEETASRRKSGPKRNAVHNERKQRCAPLALAGSTHLVNAVNQRKNFRRGPQWNKLWIVVQLQQQPQPPTVAQRECIRGHGQCRGVEVILSAQR